MASTRSLFITCPICGRSGLVLFVSIAGHSPSEYVRMARQLEEAGGVDALELNISCPNVAGGVDFGTDPDLCGELVGAVRKPAACRFWPN